jgi:glycosyltransferase involved in cell wall biosynthesis
MKVAIVHDYLHQYGGAEKVIENWLSMYPDADIYTSFFTPNTFLDSKEINLAHKQGRIETTWLQHFIPKIIKYYKYFFWLFPIVMSRLVVKNYDLVLISSTYCGKNVRYNNCPKLIHYCHSPTRFLHGLITETDHKSLNPILKFLIPIFIFPLKKLDLQAVKYLNSNGCKWISNSKFIQETIENVYQTKSTLIYPPIEIDQFLKLKKTTLPKTFFLSHGRISFHKRLDLAIESCLELNEKLVISGQSALPKEMIDLRNIVKIAEEKDSSKKGLVTFLGRTSQEKYLDLLRHCKGFLFPGKEDFGIAPIEVLASGTPIIAFGQGGALEYIENNINGVLFKNQNISDICTAIKKFKSSKFNPSLIKKTSTRFNQDIFKKEMKKIINSFD